MLLSYFGEHKSKILEAAGVETRKADKQELMQIWGKLNSSVWQRRGIVHEGGSEGKAKFFYHAPNDEEAREQPVKEEEAEKVNEARLEMTHERNLELASALVDFVISKGEGGVLTEEARTYLFSLANSKNYALNTIAKHAHVITIAMGKKEFGPKRFVKWPVEGKLHYVSAQFVPNEGEPSHVDTVQPEKKKSKKKQKQESSSEPTFHVTQHKQSVVVEYGTQRIEVKLEGQKLVANKWRKE
jgi:hypothetical protein